MDPPNAGRDPRTTGHGYAIRYTSAWCICCRSSIPGTKSSRRTNIDCSRRCARSSIGAKILRYRAQGGFLPDWLRNAVPLMVSPGYSSSHVTSQDGRTLLAYVYNTSRHERQYYWLGGTLHRSPKPVPLAMELGSNFKKKGRARVYDLNAKQLLDDAPAQGARRFEFGETDHDYFVVLTPS